MKVRKLVGMKTNGKAQRAGLLKHARGLLRRERDAFAKGVDRIGQALGGDRRQHGVADGVDIAAAVTFHFRRHRVCAEESGSNRHCARAAEAPRGLQLAAFGIEVEAVAGFDLDGGDTLRDQRVEPRQRGGDQLLGIGLPRRLHRRDDAAAGARNLLVARAGQPLFEFPGAIAAIDQMGMTVDQPRRDPASFAVGPLLRLECRRCIRGGAGIDDAAAGGGDHSVFDQAEALAQRRKRCKATSVPNLID